MPSAARFILKDSPEPLRDLVIPAEDLQGRTYSAECAQQPGGIQAAELYLGLQFACLAITDDEPNTLRKVSKVNPWQELAMEIIAGDAEKAHQPLSKTLKEKFNLETDHIISVSGMSPAGHALDTQGYIAHNQEMIVLAYRCTTSAADWLTNLSTTTSAWEIEEDVAQGHSGYFSSCCGFPICETSGASKPRVHTGFYNNLLCTIPLIRKHIDPLLAADQPPRTLYVVGHSLGAGIATLAACYLLLEQQYDWNNSPHQLRVVTAGCPRAVSSYMQEVIENRLKELNDNPDKVIWARVVRDKDAVPTVPPEILGFRHLPQKEVFLTKEDTSGKSHILINPSLKNIVPKRKMKALLKEYPSLLASNADADADDDNRSWTEAPSVDGTSFEEEEKDDNGDGSSVGSPEPIEEAPCADSSSSKKETNNGFRVVPRPLRDHMPQFYLKPLMAQVLEERGEVVRKVDQEQDEGTVSTTAEAIDHDALEKSNKALSELQPKKKIGRIFRLRRKDRTVIPAS